MPVNTVQLFAQPSWQDIDRRRVLATELGRTMPAGEIRSNTQGIAHVMGKWGEAYQNHKAGKLDAEKRAALTKALGPKFQEMGVDPAFMDGMEGQDMARLYAQMAIQEAQRRASENSPDSELKRRYQQAQIANLESQTRERDNPLAKAERGLQPQYGVDANGNPVILQLGKDGTATQTKLPDGVTLSKEPIKIDAGTHFVLLDPITRQPVGQIPKELHQAEYEKATGKAQAEAAANLPSVNSEADRAIQMVDELLVHPGLESSVGTIQGRMPDWLMGAYDENVADFRTRIEQARGKAFLEAYNALRGGGQITEVEGNKAENALARLNMAVSEKDYRKALQDFKDAVRQGQQIMRTKAGAPIPQQDTGSGWSDMGGGVKIRRKQ